MVVTSVPLCLVECVRVRWRVVSACACCCACGVRWRACARLVHVNCLRKVPATTRARALTASFSSLIS